MREGLPLDALCMLEGDKLKSKLWPTLEETVADERVHLIFLNRNLPPNAWRPTLAKLTQPTRFLARKMRLIAVVPGCEGGTRNAYSLRHFAVCLHGLQCRRDHPTSLDLEFKETAQVAWPPSF